MYWFYSLPVLVAPSKGIGSIFCLLQPVFSHVGTLGRETFSGILEGLEKEKFDSTFWNPQLGDGFKYFLFSHFD